MKAMVFHGPHRRAWEDVPDAALHDPTDAVVSVDDVPTVFVKEGDGFRAHAVRVARYAGPRVYLDDGVKPDATVVIRGALLLKGELLRAELE